eukprot:2048260-Rhodomonas_salina.1
MEAELVGECAREREGKGAYQDIVEEREDLGRGLEERDDGGGLELVAVPAQRLRDVVRGRGVEARADLIQAQHHLRPEQHLRGRHALLLAPGHPAQVAVADHCVLAVLEPEEVEQRFHFGPRLEVDAGG